MRRAAKKSKMRPTLCAGFVSIVFLGVVSGCDEARQVSPSPRPTVTLSSEPPSHPLPSAVDKPTPIPAALSKTQRLLLEGARSTLGDVYDDGYFAGGPPPEGRGACTDVVYEACLAAGLNLQDLIEQDIAVEAGGYPNLGDRNINYRRAPNLIVWFQRHTKALPSDADFRPGDIVFWSLLDDGVVDHVGIVAEREGFVIHNIGPRCSEDRSLQSWKIVGHFRLRSD